MSQFAGLYQIRDIKAEDVNFVLATFLRGVYYGDSAFSKMPKDKFMKNYEPVAKALVQKRTVKVACLNEDPDVIIGYSILSNDFQTIDWVYVKKQWRNNGIGRSLVPQYPTQVSHINKLGNDLLPKFDNCIFNPFAIA